MAPTARAATALALVALLVSLVACGGSEHPPATLSIDVRGATKVVADAAELMEECYRDGREPELCTSGTVHQIAKLCIDLAGHGDVTLADPAGAITVYPADNPRYGEVSCLFATPRTNLSVELWRTPPPSMCSAGAGFAGACAPLGHGLEVGRRRDLPSISVAGRAGRVVTTAASPLLDAAQLVAVTQELTRVVFDVTVSSADLATVQGLSTKPS